ncbi:hypothetical protein ACCT09_44090, partial [Rhizobium ruizarguesonis]
MRRMQKIGRAVGKESAIQLIDHQDEDIRTRHVKLSPVVSKAGGPMKGTSLLLFADLIKASIIVPVKLAFFDGCQKEFLCQTARLSWDG